MSWTHVFVLVSPPRIWRVITPVRALRASTGRTARSAPWRAPTGRVSMEEPASRTPPAVTAAAARPGSPAPTVRRESTDAAATPALTVRTNCRLQLTHIQNNPTSTHRLNFTAEPVSFTSAAALCGNYDFVHVSLYKLAFEEVSAKEEKVKRKLLNAEYDSRELRCAVTRPSATSRTHCSL